MVDIKGRSFLITGGASLVGSHIAEHLLEAGAASVVLFDNYSLGTPETLRAFENDDRVKIVRSDILRTNDLYDHLEGIDGVFAVAAFLTMPLTQNPWLGIDVNVRGMLNTLDACRYRGVKKVVFSSSTATFGDTDDYPVTEDTPFCWQGLQPGGAIYGATKLIGENLCRLYGQRYGIEFVALRYSTVYGERQHYRGVNSLYILEAYDRIKAGHAPVLPGDGNEVHDYVYVGDLARANLMAMASAICGESFLAVSGVDTTLNRIVEILLNITGSALKPEYREEAGRVRFTAKSRIGFSREKITRMLGWQPQVDLESGIRRLIDWHEKARRVSDDGAAEIKS